jgi:hypothetical protein
MFDECTALSNVVIPEGVTEIGDQAFEECRALTSITLPSTIRRIGGGAFLNCSSLAAITIPEAVRQVEFGGNTRNQDFRTLTIGYPFQGCSRLSLASQAALRRVGYTASF